MIRLIEDTPDITNQSKQIIYSALFGVLHTWANEPCRATCISELALKRVFSHSGMDYNEVVTQFRNYIDESIREVSSHWSLLKSNVLLALSFLLVKALYKSKTTTDQKFIMAILIHIIARHLSVRFTRYVPICNPEFVQKAIQRLRTTSLIAKGFDKMIIYIAKSMINKIKTLNLLSGNELASFHAAVWSRINQSLRAFAKAYYAIAKESIEAKEKKIEVEKVVETVIKNINDLVESGEVRDLVVGYITNNIYNIDKRQELIVYSSVMFEKIHQIIKTGQPTAIYNSIVQLIRKTVETISSFFNIESFSDINENFKNIVKRLYYSNVVKYNSKMTLKHMFDNAQITVSRDHILLLISIIVAMVCIVLVTGEGK